MRKVLEQDLKSRFGGSVGPVSAGDKVSISEDFTDFDDWAEGVAELINGFCLPSSDEIGLISTVDYGGETEPGKWFCIATFDSGVEMKLKHSEWDSFAHYAHLYFKVHSSAQLDWLVERCREATPAICPVIWPLRE